MQFAINDGRVDAARSSRNELSARGRLTATILDCAQRQDEGSTNLSEIRVTLDEVLVHDCRFPFHLAAYVKERCGCTRVAIALLVEAANRVGVARRRAGRPCVLPFALRPLVHRVVRTPSEAAYAMAYQVRHFGWAMPTPLRAALTEVVHRNGGTSRICADGEEAVSRAPRRVPQPVLATA